MSFLLGQTLATYAINQAMQLDSFGSFVQSSLRRHHAKDWGDCGEEDLKINDESLKLGMRLFSVYNIPQNLKEIDCQGNDRIWIITEANRSATTVLFPSEY